MSKVTVSDFVACKRFFSDNTYSMDHGYVIAVDAYTADIRFGDGATEKHYFSAIRPA